jgi:hypothetical protein
MWYRVQYKVVHLKTLYADEWLHEHFEQCLWEQEIYFICYMHIRELSSNYSL